VRVPRSVASRRWIWPSACCRSGRAANRRSPRRSSEPAPCAGSCAQCSQDFALGYVDDRKLATEWIERGKVRGFGSLRIQDQLRRLNVDERIVESATLGGREERALARRLLAERFGAGDLADRRIAARAARFLARRGFPAEVIDSLFDSWE
jgi:regulatory protein